MKNITEFLSRYLKSLYDYNLFKKFFNEKIFIAIIFIIPIFLIFAAQNYIGAIAPLNKVSNTFDGLYNNISKENIKFKDGYIIFEQDEIFEDSFEVNNEEISIAIDTDNELDIYLKVEGEYTDEEIERLKFDKDSLDVYIGDSFSLINYYGRVMSYDLSILYGELNSTEQIYNFLKDNYVNKGIIVIISLITGFIIFALYFTVVFFTMYSITKRDNYKLSINRKIKLTIYAMPAGAYSYLILNYFMKTSETAITLVVPIVSMLAMVYVISKTLINVKEFVFIEEKKKKRALKKSK